MQVQFWKVTLPRERAAGGCEPILRAKEIKKEKNQDVARWQRCVAGVMIQVAGGHVQNNRGRRRLAFRC